MSKKEKKTKETPGVKEVVRKQIITNIIVYIILVACSWWLTFRLWGPAGNVSTLLGYIACMIPFFTIQLTYSAFVKERAELAHGKSEIKADEISFAAEPLTSIWALILPRALIYGFGSMLIVVGLIQYSGCQPPTLAVVFIVLVVPIITFSLLIKKYLPRYLPTFAAALKKGNKVAPQALAGYFIVVHVVPFFLAQAYINACIANRAFHFEAAKVGTSHLPADYLMPDSFILFVILGLVHWLHSNEITRADVRLGKVSAEKLKNISGWLALVYVFGGALVVAAVYRLILYVGNIDGLSIGMAILYKMAVILLSVLLGSWVGMRWGGARERELLKEEAL